MAKDLSPAKIAELEDVTTACVYGWLNSGKLKGRQLEIEGRKNGPWVIKEKDYMEFINRHREGGRNE